MSPRMATVAPLDDGRMWRKLLARLHPDAGGDGELFTFGFTFGQAVRERVVDGARYSSRCDRCPSDGAGAERIDFDPPTGDPSEHLRMILALAKDAPEPYRRVLLLLIDCPTEGRYGAFATQAVGATYKQLALAAHLAGFSGEERQRWYNLAEDLSLSSRHISHLISTLKAAA